MKFKKLSTRTSYFACEAILNLTKKLPFSDANNNTELKGIAKKN